MNYKVSKAAFLCCFMAAFSGTGLAHEDLSVTVKGHLRPSCQVSNEKPTLTLGELSRAGSASVSFSISCNAPFHYALSSRNGSLVHRAGVMAKPPFFSSLPYTVTYKLGTSAGFIVDACPSSNMVGTLTSCSGRSGPNAVAIQQSVTVGFSWDPAGSFPIAGSYNDVVTITLSAGL